MKESFERDLRSMNEMVKPRFDENFEQQNLESLEREINEELEEIADNQNSSIETQRSILEIQRQKQEIIQKLKADLGCLDNPDCSLEMGENARSVKYDEDTKKYYYNNERNETLQATFGEIVTDLDWGSEYDLSSSGTPRADIKRYLLEKAKFELQDLVDEQILLSEIGNDDTDEALKNTYQAIKDRREGSTIEQSHPSFIAEKVVKNFLRQISIDKELPFEIEATDVYQDVDQKMDFIIRRKDESTGVEVEPGNDVAIQFSMNEKAREHKEKQIKRTENKLRKNNEEVKRIALVVFPIEGAMGLYRNWSRNGSIAGGPGKYLEEEVKEKLFFELLKEMYTKEEIEGFWERVE